MSDIILPDDDILGDDLQDTSFVEDFLDEEAVLPEEEETLPLALDDEEEEEDDDLLGDYDPDEWN